MIKLLKILSFCIVGFYICPGIPNVFGETNVSGNITNDTVWSKSNSPYIVTGTLQVYPHVTLTIEPGVVIKFNSMAELKIGGELTARGTINDPIIFTSNVAPAWWTGIQFQNPCETTLYDPGGNFLSGSIFENCIIEFSWGITTTQSNCNPFITKSTFNTSGIRLDWGASPIIITDNNINNGFIWAKSNHVNISNNISKIFQDWDIVAEGENVNISNNIVTSGSIRAGGQCEITNNQVTGGGICTNYGCGDLSFSGYSHITDNTIKSGGITLNYGGYVSKNIIEDGLNGILVRNLAKATTIIGNTIRNSYFEGVNIENRTLSVVIKNNIIAENVGKQAGAFGGIYYADEDGYQPGNLIVNENDIFGNLPYNLYNDSSSQMDATNNWWGTTDIGVIGQHIFDYYDDFTKGRVIVSPIATSAFFPPSPPTLSSPPNGVAGIATNPTLNWSASSGASSYRLQLSMREDFATTNVDQGGITANSYMVSGLLNNTTYYWRVNATNGGKTSDWSTVWNFTTIPPAVPSTVATNPSGLQIIVDGSTYTSPHTFDWTPGSSHNLSVSSPQSGTPGTRYVYFSWSDGGTQTHTINAPSSSTTYTASFTTQYSLTTSVNPSGAGTITPSGTNWYDSGQSVSISATANPGYTFGNWSGEISGTANSTPITMNGPKNVVANFTQNQYTLTININPTGSGSVTRNPNKSTYVYGDVVKLTANAATGYSFSSWSGDASGTNSPVALTIDSNKTVAANFTSTSVTPTAYEFGNVKVKKSKTASFVVKNNGKTNLSITSAITGTDASMFKITSGSGSKTIKPRKTFTIKVAFKPTSIGSKSANLEITSNDPVRPTIDIPLSGIGM